MSKHRRIRCKKCGELFETAGKCIRCGRWLCDGCFWPDGKRVGNLCGDCHGKRQRKKTKPNCVCVEFKDQSVVIPLPRSKKAVEHFHELSDFQDGLVRLVLAAVNEAYCNHLSITVRPDRLALTQLGYPWDGWE